MTTPPVCPKCQKKLDAKTQLTIDIPALVSSWEGEKKPSTSKSFNCYNCGESLQLLINLALVEIKKSVDLSESAICDSGFTHQELVFLQEVRQSGTFNIFVDVVSKLRSSEGHTPPNRMEQYFINFLKTSQQLKVGVDVINRFKQKFGEPISIFHAQGICMIIAGKEVRMFIPKKFLTRRTEPKMTTSSKPDRASDDLSEHIQTGFGYVPRGRGLFMESLKQSLGHRGRDMKPIPIR